jgi:hypothetical protein
MTQVIVDKFDITLYLTDKIQAAVELPEILEHIVQKTFRKKYGINMGVLPDVANTIDHDTMDTLYAGPSGKQNFIVWNGYAVFDQADTKKFGFLGSRFRSKKRLAQKLNDVLMEALKNYYIDSKVTYE